MEASFYDIHCHLNMLKQGVEASIEQALAHHVDRMITIGTGGDDHALVLELANKYIPHVFCTLGVHPHDAESYNETVEKFMLENLSQPRVVAVGEIGLDYYYNNADPYVQKRVFYRQMEIAEKVNLPVQIHTRDADEDTKAILTKFKGKVKGLLHCFTSSQDLALHALDCGFDISFSGIVTFKNAEALRQTLQLIPLDRLHVETDAPFLSPVPVRGQENVPAHVLHTARFVAEQKGVSLMELSRATRSNAQRLFTRLV